MKEIENNENQIIENIIDTILHYYPRIEREEMLFDYPQSQIDIIMHFIQVEGKDYTSIYFCNGTIDVRCSFNSPETFLVKGLVSPNTVNELIFNILEDYDYFRSVYLIGDNIDIEFGLDLKYGSRYGIGCNRIKLELDFYGYPNKEELQENYINEIIKVYTEELNHSLGVSDEIKHKLKKMH